METNQETCVAEARQSFWLRRRWLKWVAGGVLLTLVISAVVVDLGLRRAEPFLRAQLVAELEDHFHARVELDSFHLSLVNGLWAEGKGLRIWPPARFGGVGVPAGLGEPLIRLDEFRFHAPLRYAPGKPIHVSLVELKGLRVDLPPKSHFEHAAAEGAGSSDAAGTPKSAMAGLVSFELDRIDCTEAELVMETSKPGKLPLEFQVAQFKLTGITSDSQMGFDAELTNPKPRGTIFSMGQIGPWQTTDPGQTPIRGNYRFENANLADFKWIAGILSSTGHYQGTLRDLAVDGETETPDFRLTQVGNALALTTRFHAQVDGTNGDTWLEPVDATLGRSHFTATGQIVRVTAAGDDGTPHSAGHDIDLKVNVDKGRIEDFMRLASKSDKALLTGDVTVKTMLHIPPGPEPMQERLHMNGWFSLDKAVFTSPKIQGRIAELSLRGQGRPDELKTADPDGILSQMQSGFQLEGGVITLPALDFTVPGAKIQLKGTYALEGGGLNFDGSAKMEASVSKMVGGWKGLLLSPADRYFKKDGAGTEIPVHVKGTREAPEFGIEFEKMKLEVKPGEKE
jgi:hypothetical protein